MGAMKNIITIYEEMCRDNMISGYPDLSEKEPQNSFENPYINSSVVAIDKIITDDNMINVRFIAWKENKINAYFLEHPMCIMDERVFGSFSIDEARAIFKNLLSRGFTLKPT